MWWLWWLENAWRVCEICVEKFGVVVGPPGGAIRRDKRVSHTAQYAFSTAELPGSFLEVK
jgi:hypothetical protein